MSGGLERSGTGLWFANMEEKNMENFRVKSRICFLQSWGLNPLKSNHGNTWQISNSNDIILSALKAPFKQFPKQQKGKTLESNVSSRRSKRKSLQWQDG